MVDSLPVLSSGWPPRRRISGQWEASFGIKDSSLPLFEERCICMDGWMAVGFEEQKVCGILLGICRLRLNVQAIRVISH